MPARKQSRVLRARRRADSRGNARDGRSIVSDFKLTPNRSKWDGAGNETSRGDHGQPFLKRGGPIAVSKCAARAASPRGRARFVFGRFSAATNLRLARTLANTQTIYKSLKNCPKIVGKITVINGFIQVSQWM